MAKFVPWNSQPLEEWSKKYAIGKFIDLDGHRTHYIEKGQGKPIILLHGYFYDLLQWRKNIDALAEVFKVYAFDLWGFGYSTREPMDYSYQLYADQLLKFMDTLNIRKASRWGSPWVAEPAYCFAPSTGSELTRWFWWLQGGCPILRLC